MDGYHSESKNGGRIVAAVFGNRIRHVNSQVVKEDGGFKDADATVYSSKDSDDDTLGFSEPKFDSVKNVLSDPDLSKKIETFLREIKKYRVSGGDLIRVSIDNLQSSSPDIYIGDTEPIVIESGQDIEIGETEVVDLSDNYKEMGESAEDVNDMVKVANTEGSKKTDAFKYVSSGLVDKSGVKEGKGILGKQELPYLFEEQEEIEGPLVPRRSLKDTNKIFEDVPDDVGTTGVDNIADADNIKIANKRGLTFYQPRWWSQEGGFDDHIMD